MMYDFMDFDSTGDDFQQTGKPYLPEKMDCMRCGVCLSACPTFKITGDEKFGPRHRVDLLRQLQQQETLDDSAQQQLSSCIQCRACENVCPSQMDYGELFENAQAQLSEGQSVRFLARLALQLIKQKQRFYTILPLVRFYQKSGLQKLLRRLKLLDSFSLQHADRLLTEPGLTTLQEKYPAQQAKGQVALFTACLSERFDRETLDSAIKVLNHIGYDVLIPPQQVCCGAIHQHNGQQQTAKKLMQCNVAVFSTMPVAAIIYCATGCGSQLQDYQRILKEQNPTEFNDRLIEISDFIEQHWPDGLTLNACEQKIRLHEPCSQHHVLKNQHSLYQLLQRISSANIAGLADNAMCCGAGGSYMLSHPDNAAQLAALKWQAIKNDNPDYLLSSNFACALHLSKSDAALQDVRVMHPVTLLASLLPG